MNAASYSAIANAVASIAAGVTPTLLAKVIDSAGWTAAYMVVLGLCVFVFVSLLIIDLFVVVRNKRFTKQ